MSDPGVTREEAAAVRLQVLALARQRFTNEEIGERVGRSPERVKEIRRDLLRKMEALELSEASLLIVQERDAVRLQMQRLEERMQDHPGHGYDAHTAWLALEKRLLELSGIRVDTANQVTQINIASPGAALEMRDKPTGELEAILAEALRQIRAPRELLGDGAPDREGGEE